MDKMRKVLIAFLGKNNYAETNYILDDRLYSERLAFRAIHTHFSPVDETYVIGTKESRWEMLDNFPHKPVFIPYGKNQSDFWETFDILRENIDVQNSEVIFDFTHGFRVLPLFSAIYVRFLGYIEPTAHFSHIYYGSYEQGQKETPIVDLSPFLDLLDWIDAANDLIKYGEFESLSQKVKKAYTRARKENHPSKPNVMGTFSNRLDTMSRMLRLTNTPMLAKESKDVYTMIINDTALKDELNTFVKPFGMLLGKLSENMSIFIKPTLWESHLAVAKWYYENRRYTQSLLVLREAIITYNCEETGCDVYDLDERERIKNHLNDNRTKSSNEIYKVWNKVINLRNSVGHAFMKQKDDMSTPARITGKIDGLIRDTYNIFSGEK